MDGVATVMPDKTRVGKCDLAAALEQAPTNVHVVARGAKLRVKPVRLLERPFPKSHVAAGDVLRVAVVEHHVRRAAWRNRDTAGDGIVLRRRKIVAADCARIGLEQIPDKVVEPVFVGAQSLSVKATISPVAAWMPVLRAALKPMFGWWIARTVG